jgi:hypothetical protein
VTLHRVSYRIVGNRFDINILTQKKKNTNEGNPGSAKDRAVTRQDTPGWFGQIYQSPHVLNLGSDMRLSPTAGWEHRGKENLANGKEMIGQPQGHRRGLGLVLFLPKGSVNG